MRLSTSFMALVAVLSSAANAFPQYGSLAGLTRSQVEEVMPLLIKRGAQPAPPPLNDTSSKLVNDAAHPWMPLREGDIRGPCPGLNTLASHGYIDRSGVDTPANILNAVQEGFNMGWNLATLITYAAMIVDGNQLTNLMSIGQKTSETGPFPPAPAIVGGLNTHGVFEGDASMTRADFFFGDNHDFNETLFDEFEAFSHQYGGGNWNLTVSAEFRYHRIQESIATNPNFTFVLPRYATAYAEATFPSAFFVDGRVQDGQLNLTQARGFFQNNQMPDGFFRRNGSYDFEEINPDFDFVFNAHPVPEGANDGVNNFVPSGSSDNGICDIYTTFVSETVNELYPDPQGDLLDALNLNLENFYSSITEFNCTQLFPYGQ